MHHQVCVLDYLVMGRKLPNLRSTLSICTTALCCFMYIRMKSASEADTEWGSRYKPAPSPPLPASLVFATVAVAALQRSISLAVRGVAKSRPRWALIAP